MLVVGIVGDRDDVDAGGVAIVLDGVGGSVDGDRGGQLRIVLQHKNNKHNDPGQCDFY